MKERLEKVAHLFQKYDSPISVAVRMAQFALESKAGQSELFKKSNNGFGIKASPPWTGDKVLHNSMEVGGAEDSYFRKYPSLEASVKDHADFFTSTSHRAQVAYKDAIEATNYKDEAHALTGIYAGDKQYGQKLIKIIEDYNLTQYNKEEVFMSFPKPKIIDRRRQALGYPGHGVYAKRPLTNIQYIVWHYTATTHTGYGATVIANHEAYWKRQHGWEIGGYNYYIDRAGNIFWNYDLAIVTYGAGSVNPRAMHISLEASHKNNYTAAQLKAREELTLWLLTNELKHLGGNAIKGHKEFMNTSCPGYSIATLNNYRKEFTRKLADKNWVDNKPEEVELELSKNGKHTVKHGDTLWAIGQAYDVPLEKLREWNSIKEGQWLKTGQIIYVVEPKDNAYTVKAGDYLWKIATEHGVTVDNLKDWNDLKTNLIYVGQELFVTDPESEFKPPVSPEPPKDDIVVEKPKDDPKTPAIDLKEGQYLRWDGKVVEETVVGEIDLD